MKPGVHLALTRWKSSFTWSATGAYQVEVQFHLVRHRAAGLAGPGRGPYWSTGGLKVNEMLALPPGVVTVTVTVPAFPAGLVRVIWLAESELGLSATPPKLTVAPVRLAPVIVTGVATPAGPLDGEIELIVGAGVT